MPRAWVDAAGAAPGAEWFIAAAIYFHSRQAGTPNIERFQAKWRPVRVKKTRQNEKAAQSLGKTDRNRRRPVGNTPNWVGLAKPSVLNPDHAPGFAAGCHSGAGHPD